MRKTVNPQAIEAEVAALGDLDLSALRRRWEQLYGNPPPKSLRRAFLIKACAYQIQVQAFGGLKPATKRRLREIAEAARNGTMDAVVSAPRLKPGVRLVRAWQGKTHVVTVLADGRFEWDGARHRSLSAIAKAITGTNWNGHIFFGVKQTPAGRAVRNDDDLVDEPTAPPLAADDSVAPDASVSPTPSTPAKPARSRTEAPAHG